MEVFISRFVSQAGFQYPTQAERYVPAQGELSVMSRDIIYLGLPRAASSRNYVMVQTRGPQLSKPEASKNVLPRMGRCSPQASLFGNLPGE